MHTPPFHSYASSTSKESARSKHKVMQISTLEGVKRDILNDLMIFEAEPSDKGIRP